MTKIGEKVWEKVVAKVLDYTSDNAEKIIDVMNEIKEIGEDEVIENSKKTPKELFEEEGYDFYECKTEEDIQKFKKYYNNEKENKNII